MVAALPAERRELQELALGLEPVDELGARDQPLALRLRVGAVAAVWRDRRPARTWVERFDWRAIESFEFRD